MPSASIGLRRARTGKAAPTPYLSHIHNFRGFAILVIVITHCFALFDWSGNPGLADFLKRVFANGTIFFVFISGYLFQYLSGRYRVADFYRKKFRNIVVPYVIISIPALIAFTAFARRPGAPAGLYERPMLEQVLYFLTTGSHLAPYWYLPTLIVFFAAAPLFHWLDRRRWLYWCLPALPFVPILVPLSGANPLVTFVHFLPVWILGMACSRFQRFANDWLGRGLWFLIALAVLLFIAELAFAPGRYSWYSEMHKVALTLVLLESFRRWGNRVDHWFSMPGTLSFGIYLLHSYLISGARAVCEAVLGGLPAGGLVVFGLGATMAVAVCIATAELLARRLGPLSRLVMGVEPTKAAEHPSTGTALIAARETLTSRPPAAHRDTVR